MKKYWKQIVISILSIYIIISAILPSKNEPNYKVVDVDKIKKEAVDSVNNEQNKILVVKLDSANKVYDSKLTPLKKEVISLKAKLKNQTEEYKTDTVAQSPISDSIIHTANQVIDSLDYEVELLTGIRENMQLKIEAISLSRDIGEKNLLASYLENDKLKKELKRQTNWWHRNDKWILLGSGVILTLLLVK